MKTSVTLTQDLIKRLDRAKKKGESRSEAIERLLSESLHAEARRSTDLQDGRDRRWFYFFRKTGCVQARWPLASSTRART